MKKSIVFLCLFAIGLIFSCSKKEGIKEFKQEEFFMFKVISYEWNDEAKARLVIIKDKETKCEYILVDVIKGGGIFPRMNSAGKQLCF